MNKTIAAVAVAVSWICFGNSVSAQKYTLEECRAMALEQNADMKLARNNLSGAEQRRKEAFSNFFPTLGLGGGGLVTTNGLIQMPLGQQKMEMMENGIIGGVSATIPVYTGGRIYTGNKLARLGVEVSASKLSQTENDVLVSVEQYFWQIIVLKEKLHTLRQTEALLENIEVDAATSVSAGIKNPNDLLLVQLKLNDTRSARRNLENNLSLSKMLLAQYIGAEQNTFDVVSDLQSMSFQSPEDLKVEHVQALASIPEYKLLNYNVKAADLQKKMTRGEYLPSVAVGGAYVYHNLMDFSQNTTIGYVSISIPISWKTAFSIKEQKYECQNAKTSLDDGSEKLLLKMQQAWNDLTNAYEQINLAKEAIVQSSENLRLNREYYKAGTSSMSDLLDAQTLYQQGRDKLTEARAQYEIKKTEYLKATGR